MLAYTNKSSSIPSTPGIALRNLQVGTSDARVEQLLPEQRSERLSTYVVTFTNWLEAAVSTRLEREKAIQRSDQVTVFFDGYLTDVVVRKKNHDIDLNYPASAVLTLYKNSGYSAFSDLRGSFVILVVDESSRTAQLVTDRRASRPVFVRYLNGAFYAAAPTVSALARFPHELSTVQASTVLEFMISATFRGNSTLYREIRKLSNGSMLRLDGTDAAIGCYWQMRFAASDRSVEDLLEECDALLDQAVTRLLRTPERKFLFLSGGIDSRVILGYLQRHLGSNVDVAYYWSDLTDGDDAYVAGQLAEKYDLKKQEFEIRLSDFVSTAPIVTLQSDCRSEVVDAAPLYRFWDVLSQDYEGYVNGDESFGWHRNVSSIDEGLDEIGWFGLAQVNRLKSWLDSATAKQMTKDILDHLREIVSKVDEANPDDLKDRLYYEERLGNMLNGFSWSMLHKLEGYRPLIDEDVIDFVCTLPNEWRGDKQLLRKLLSVKFPEIASIPASKQDVLPTPAKFLAFLQANEEARAFFREQLIDKLHPQLAGIFSTREYKDSIRAMLEGNSLPIIGKRWYGRIPGAWRFAGSLENRVHPFLLALRLLQLNLYMTSKS